VPLLAAALDACAPLGVNVEIKNLPNDPDFDPDAAIVATVAEAIGGRAGLDQAILVSCFHPGTLARLRAIDDRIATAVLTFDLPDPLATIALAQAAGHDALHPFNATVTADLVDAAHAAGLAVNVWTVDDPARMVELARLGVDGIVTNVPDVACAALRSSPNPVRPA
jgi:glycerophosphoryl diester phosphodiesterase